MEQGQPETDTAHSELSAPPDTVERSLSADELFGVLSHSTNRFILHYLIKVNRPVSTYELIEYATTTHNSSDDLTTGELRGDIRASVERRIPQLAKLGLVRYNSDKGNVSVTAKTHTVEPYLSLALAHTD